MDEMDEVIEEQKNRRQAGVVGTVHATEYQYGVKEAIMIARGGTLRVAVVQLDPGLVQVVGLCLSLGKGDPMAAERGKSGQLALAAGSVGWSDGRDVANREARRELHFGGIHEARQIDRADSSRAGANCEREHLRGKSCGAAISPAELNWPTAGHLACLFVAILSLTASASKDFYQGGVSFPHTMPAPMLHSR